MSPVNRRRVNLPKPTTRKAPNLSKINRWKMRGKIQTKGPIPKVVIQKALAKRSSVPLGVSPVAEQKTVKRDSAERINQLKISRKPISSKPRNQPSVYNDLRNSSMRIKLIKGIKQPSFRKAIAKLMINNEHKSDPNIGFIHGGTYAFKPILSTGFFMTCQTVPGAMGVLKTMVLSKNWATLPSFEKRKQINALETFIHSLGKNEFSRMVTNKEKKELLLKSISEITTRGYRSDKITVLFGTFDARDAIGEVSAQERRAILARTNSILRHTKKMSIRTINERQKLLKNLENIYGYGEETKKRLELLEKKGKLNPKQAKLLQEIKEGKRVTLTKLKEMTQVLMSNKLIDNVFLRKLVSTKEGVFTAYNLVNNNQGKTIYSIFMKNNYAKGLFNSLISTPEGVKRLNRALSQQGKRVFYAKLMTVASNKSAVWNVIEYFIENDVVELNKLPKEIGEELKDAIKIMKTSARNKK